MSYIDVPRLHFAGTFSANPSTINNTPANYNPKVTHPAEAWNPNGNHAWQFLNCTVRTVVDSNGNVSTDPSQDPIIGAAVQSTNQPYVAKLVDLDPDQQMVSQIWGLQVKVALASGTDYFVGDFRVEPFNDIFFRLIGGQPDSIFSAYYQSVLDEVSWGQTAGSPFLQQLFNTSPGALSIKFVVDGFQDDSTEPNFTQGRVVGTIGPAYAGEPPNFLLGRMLRPTNFNPKNPFNGTPLYFAPAKVDPIRGKVLFDLGNSVPTASAGGPPPTNLGTLQAAIVPKSGSPVILGNIDYSEDAYLATAGIQEFSVTPDQLKKLAKTPLGVVQLATAGQPSVVLKENSIGGYLNATNYVYRMNPGDVDVVTLITTAFGQPKAGQKINLQLSTFDGSSVGRRPPVVIPRSVVTGDDGRVSFAMSARDPGNPRKFIDGQVYQVSFSWAGAPSDYTPDPSEFLSVLVFSSYDKRPTWKNIQPILQQYAKLYPAMVQILDIDDYETIKANIDSLLMVLNLPESNPGVMPVTRDLSRDKRQLMIEWLRLGAPK